MTQAPTLTSARRPSPGWTAAVSIAFGIFGLIPALLHSSRARSAGRPVAAYWVAFGVGLVVNLVLVALLLLAGFVWLAWLADDSRDGDPAQWSAPAVVRAAGSA